MSVASVARRERSELGGLMLQVGPDAPTLDAGWTVLDLAAHLVSREYDPWAGPGLVLGGPFRKLTEMAMKRRRREGLGRLVARIRRGPPPWLRPAPAGMHLNEYYLHHEDVRRANGMAPRTGDRELDEALARVLRASSALLARRVAVGLELVWNGGVLVRTGDEPRAVLSGAPGELLLYLSGRREASEVQLSGDAGALDALRRADLSL